MPRKEGTAGWCRVVLVTAAMGACDLQQPGLLSRADASADAEVDGANQLTAGAAGAGSGGMGGHSAMGGAGGRPQPPSQMEGGRVTDVSTHSDSGSGPDGGGCGSATDVHNCGSCGHDCTRLSHVVPANVGCSDGRCVITSSSCSPSYAHCSSNPDDGCELLALTVDNCGGCGLTCMPESSCAAGLCNTPLGYYTKLCDGSWYGHTNYMVGYQLLVPNDATLLSFGSILERGGTFNFALYTDVAGNPGDLIAQSGEQDIANGSTTPLEVAAEFAVAPVQLKANNYWLFFMLTSANGGLCIDANAPMKLLYQATLSSAVFPSAFPSTGLVSSQSPWNAYIRVRMPGG